DEPTLPLIESNFAHFVGLEKHVCKLAKDYKYRKEQFTPPLQIRYMRSIPDSPQIRIMLELDLLRKRIDQLEVENTEGKAENEMLKKLIDENAENAKLKVELEKNKTEVAKLRHDIKEIKQQTQIITNAQYFKNNGT
ncbi:17594_t:CDS:2, partial [Gigaspora rosea]